MAILTAILNTVTVLICLFMICLILIQRGKGGGLAGAFGGVGGSSAFGTKAGDVFTRVTMVVATIWIVLSMLLVVVYNRPRASAYDDGRSAEVSKEITPKSKATGKAPTTDTRAAGSGTAIPEPSTAGSKIPAAIPEPSTPAAK